MNSHLFPDLPYLFPICVTVFSSITFVFSCFYIADTTFKKKTFHKSYVEVIIIVSLFITFISHILSMFQYSSTLPIIDSRLIVMLFSLIVALTALIITVTNNKRTSENNLDVHHTNLLIKMIENNYKLINDEEIKKIIQEDILEEIKKKFQIDYLKYIALTKKMMLEKDNTLSSEQMEKFKVKFGITSPGDSMNEIYKQDKRSLINLSEFKKDGIERFLVSYFSEKENNWSNKSGVSKKYSSDFTYKKILDNDGMFLKELADNKYQELLEEIEENGHSVLIQNFDEIKNELNTIYDRKYQEIGHFFRHTHRIIKLINKYYPEIKEKRSEFLGILRAYYSEDILLAIYYNSTYTDKGMGLGVQLAYSDFFGNLKDLAAYDLPHFRKEKLIFQSLDLNILKEVYTFPQNNDSLYREILTIEVFEEKIKKTFEKR